MNLLIYYYHFQTIHKYFLLKFLFRRYNGILSVRSTEDKTSDDNKYVHRGIARRAFSRKWTLSDDMVVKGAEFQNGLLNISLEKVIPEEKKPRLIPIKNHSKVIDHKDK